MFSKYYQSELNYLREMGREFSQAFPSVAPLLADRKGDPDVERLLEGFAFLTGQIRERMDDAVPEFILRIAELTTPQYVRPLPAATIMQFDSDLRQIRGTTTVPAGTEIMSRPVRGTNCRFQTCWPVEAIPLTIENVALDDRNPSAPRISLQFRTNAAGRKSLAYPRPLRMYLHAENQLASTLMLWLTQHCNQIRVTDSDAAQRETRLPTSSIAQLGFDEATRLLPWPQSAPEMTRLALEYFTLPEKFNFIDLHGLHLANLSGDSFSVTFEFRAPPRLAGNLPADIFRLNCAPAINLFSTSAEPLTVTPLSSKQLLRAAGLPHDHAEVFEVEHVAGIAESLQSAREYYPYYALESLQPDHGHYSLDRISSPIDEATDTYLATIASTQTGMHLTDATREETLSIDLRCTNRHLPAELRAGDIRLPGRNYTASLGCRNIIPVSTPGRGPVGAALHWRIVAHLTLSKMAFTRIETLRGTLSLYNLQMLHDGPTGRSNQAKIESIRDVCATAGTIIVRGVPTRGMRVKLSIDENRFASRGEAYLFGKLLQTIYAQQTGVNSWTQVDVQLHPSATTYSWEPSLGSASTGAIA